MTDRPIIFSEPMVKALLDGRKTMTRRLAKSTSSWWNVQPGGRLWVRETWTPDVRNFNLAPRDIPRTEPIFYAAGGSMNATKMSIAQTAWRPSIHMPRWASRLTLTVTATRVERLQEITEADAEREGWAGLDADSYVSDANPVTWFARLWVGLHGPGAWDANPEVVVLSFTAAKRNIDSREAA